jgi:uncharacterized protein YpmS
VSKRVRISLLVLGGLLLLAAVAVFVLYRAARHVPEFYRRALEADQAAQAKAADRMERQAFDLTGKLQEPGDWQMAVTAEEINGWLAVQLPKQFPRLLPPAMADPRVAIEPGRILLGCRYQQGGLDSVLSLVLVPYVPQPGVLALRIAQARAGLVPLPTDGVLKTVAEALRAAKVEVDGKRQPADGQSVLRITLPTIPGKHRKRVCIDNLQLRAGELFLEGTTQREP